MEEREWEERLNDPMFSEAVEELEEDLLSIPCVIAKAVLFS